VDWGPPYVRNTEICGFRLDSVLLNEGSVLDPCMRCVTPDRLCTPLGGNLFDSRSCVTDSDKVPPFYRILRVGKHPSCFCAGGSGFECGNGDRLRGLGYFFFIRDFVSPSRQL
jgi:hypothetical protein